MAKIGYSIDYKDFDKFVERVNAGISQGRWKRLLREAATIAYEEAMRLCPVKTGWMKGQMYVEELANSLGFTLGNDAEYASYHEYGWVAEMYGGSVESPKHYKAGYRPFMRPSILKAEKYFNREIEKWLKKMFEHGR